MKSVWNTVTTIAIVLVFVVAVSQWQILWRKIAPMRADAGPSTTLTPKKAASPRSVAPALVPVKTVPRARVELPTDAPAPLRIVHTTTPAAHEPLTGEGILRETNAERLREGKVALTMSPTLVREAQRKVDDMFKEQYFAHVSPNGTTIGDLAKDAGYDYVIIGENLAEGDFTSSADVVAAWMQSPGHRANILKTGYREIGIAARRDVFEGHTTWLAVQEFGTPRSVCPATDMMLKASIDARDSEIKKEVAELDVLQQEMQVADARGDVDGYNALVGAYNEKVGLYNTLLEIQKAAVNLYNQEIANENTCLAQYK